MHDISNYGIIKSAILVDFILTDKWAKNQYYNIWSG